MADKTGISWTDATWNPVRGCSRVSEGCRNCYAERVAVRFSLVGMPYEGLATKRNGKPGWTGDVRLIPEHLADPLRWKRPRRIFVNSMSDLFHEKLTNEQIAAVFGVMAAAPQHTFQVLTKRARRMREWFEWASDRPDTVGFLVGHARSVLLDHGGDVPRGIPLPPWPLPGVWLGVSVENQEVADERIPELLRTPAAVRFLSCEPLIGPVDLRGLERANMWSGGDWLRSYRFEKEHDDGRTEVLEERKERKERIDWVIAGCESGPGARPCSIEWLRSLRDQCAAAGVAFFLKQASEQRGTDSESGDAHVIAMHLGSKRKAGGVIELPALDGEQHARFPP